jgi:hypothetical protein
MLLASAGALNSTTIPATLSKRPKPWIKLLASSSPSV